MDLSDIFFHAAVLIPLEWMILHSTPLGPMLSGFGESLWEGMGFDWGHIAHTHELG